MPLSKLTVEFYIWRKEITSDGVSRGSMRKMSFTSIAEPWLQQAKTVRASQLKEIT